MGCGQSTSVVATEEAARRQRGQGGAQRRYAARGAVDKPRPQQLMHHFPAEGQTAAAADACRRRFEVCFDERDRQALACLERSRGGSSHSSHSSNSGTFVGLPAVEVSGPDHVVATPSLAFIFGSAVQHAPSSQARLADGERPSPSCAAEDPSPRMTVFDLVQSENDDESDDGAHLSADHGRPSGSFDEPGTAEAPPLHVPAVDDVEHNGSMTRLGDSAREGVGAGVRGPGGAEYHTASSSGTSSPAIGSTLSGLDALRAKLIQPTSATLSPY